MRRTKYPPPKRWSYSSWSSWAACPYRYLKHHILGEREPPGPALIRGNVVHAKAEQYLKGNLKGPPPKELWKLAPHYRELKAMKPVVEQFWGVDRDWRPAQKDTTWCVMKMDAAVLPSQRTPGPLWIGDHKTGREYAETHEKQGSLYACIGAVTVPYAVGVDVEFWYVDLGYSQPYHYTPRRIARDTKRWIAQGELLMNEKDFLPTPSHDACKYCDLRSDKGGPCKSWKALQH